MRSKLLLVVIAVFIISSMTTHNGMAQSNKNPDNGLIPTVPSNPVDKANELLNQTQKAITPTIPQTATDLAKLPKIPKLIKTPSTKVTSIPEDTSKALEALETMKEVDRIKQTLETLKSLDRFQPLGSFVIELKNSVLYKSLTVGVSVMLAEDDIEANMAFLEKNQTMLVDTLKAELSLLTDKEIAWEQESQNVLKAVRKKINSVVGKDFIDNLFYTGFELTKK